MLLFICTFCCLKHAARKDPVFESWLHGQSCNIVYSLWREIEDKINLFFLHMWCSLCCHHKLPNRTFFNCVSILFSLHLFTSDFLNPPLGFHGDRENQAGEFSRTHVAVDIPHSDMKNDPPRKKSWWNKKILLECTSTCQEVTSVGLRSQLKACLQPQLKPMPHYACNHFSSNSICILSMMTADEDWNA